MPLGVAQDFVHQDAEENAKISHRWNENEHHTPAFERLEVFPLAQRNQRHRKNYRKCYQQKRLKS